MPREKKRNRNPYCNKCKIPMHKKGLVKIGEPRFKCRKCGAEK